jgi:hypothetical protein
VVFSLGDVVGLRSGGTGFPVFRAYYQVPNAIGWPMTSFPVGYVQGLAVSAQFWGPRFAEPDIVQAAVDFQAHFPAYHNAVPTDPAPSAGALPRAELVTPQDDGPSNDPLVGEQAIREALGR